MLAVATLGKGVVMKKPSRPFMKEQPDLTWNSLLLSDQMSQVKSASPGQGAEPGADH